MQRKDFLLLTVLLSQATPLVAMDGDQQELRDSQNAAATHTPSILSEKPKGALEEAQDFLDDLEMTDKVLEKTNEKAKGADKIIFWGCTGSGKSSSMNYLAGVPLTATEDGNLDTPTPLQGSEIGHDTVSKTRIPSPWVGPDQVVWWDMPGDEDTAGPKQRLLNGYARNHLLNGRIKNVLVASESLLTDRANGFVTLLNRFTRTLPEERRNESVVLLITKQGMVKGPSPHKKIEKLLGTPSENYGMTPQVRGLLQHLFDHKENRIAYFPYPSEFGEPYTLTEPREKIFKALDAIVFMENPDVRYENSAEDLTFIRERAHRLNKNIEASLRTGIGQKIVQICKQQSEAYKSQDPVTKRGNLLELQDNVKAIRAALQTLKETPAEDIVSFSSHLDRFFDLDNNEIKKGAKALTRLKSLSHEIEYAKDTWILALQEKIEEIDRYLRKQTTVVADKVVDFIEKINKVVSHRSLAIMSSDEEEKDLKELNQDLSTITEAVEKLKKPEERANFSPVLESRFYGKENTNSMKDDVETFMIFNSLAPGIYNFADRWPELFSSSLHSLRNIIGQKEKARDLKKRFEDEKWERATQERLRQEQEEKRRVAAAEEARRGTEAAILKTATETARQLTEQAEKRRLADLAEQKRIQAEEQGKAAEERIKIEKKAEEDKKTLLAALEAERKAREGSERKAKEDLVKAEKKAEADRKAFEAKVEEKARQAEEARKQLIAEAEKQRKADLAIAEEKRKKDLEAAEKKRKDDLTEAGSKIQNLTKTLDVTKQAAEKEKVVANGKLTALDTKTKQQEKDIETAKAEIKNLKGELDRKLTVPPTPKPQLKKIQIEYKDYVRLQKQGVTNLTAENAPTIKYYHRKGHEITRAHYEKRRNKGKGGRISPPGGKLYYKIEQ